MNSEAINAAPYIQELKSKVDQMKMDQMKAANAALLQEGLLQIAESYNQLQQEVAYAVDLMTEWRKSGVPVKLAPEVEAFIRRNSEEQK